MDNSEENRAFSNAFMDRLAERRQRVLLGVKLMDASKAQLEWELAGAQALNEEYAAVLAEAMRHKSVGDEINHQLAEILKRAPQLIRSMDAKKRVATRHAASPAAEAKKVARESFDRWVKDSSLHKTKEEFIQCFLDGTPDSVTDRTLRGWLSDWAAEVGTKPWKATP